MTAKQDAQNARKAKEREEKRAFLMDHFGVKTAEALVTQIMKLPLNVLRTIARWLKGN